VVSDPGRLRHRFVLEAASDLDDGAGGVVRTFTPAGALWADMTPLGLATRFSDGALESRATHHLRLRNGPAVSLDHRLRLGGDRLFRILAHRSAEPGYRLILVEEIQP